MPWRIARTEPRSQRKSNGFEIDLLNPRRYLRGWRRLCGPAPDRDPQLLVVELDLPAALLMTEKFAPSSLI